MIIKRFINNAIRVILARISYRQPSNSNLNFNGIIRYKIYMGICISLKKITKMRDILLSKILNPQKIWIQSSLAQLEKFKRSKWSWEFFVKPCKLVKVEREISRRHRAVKVTPFPPPIISSNWHPIWSTLRSRRNVAYLLLSRAIYIPIISDSLLDTEKNANAKKSLYDNLGRFMGRLGAVAI